MRILKPAVVYFVLVFGAGFVLGTIRVLWLVPHVGVRAAELAEVPVMLIMIALAARWTTQHTGAGLRAVALLGVGVVALCLLLAAEVTLAVAMRGVSALGTLLDRDPVSGTAYYAALVVYAILPGLLGRFGQAAVGPRA